MNGPAPQLFGANLNVAQWDHEKQKVYENCGFSIFSSTMHVSAVSTMRPGVQRSCGNSSQTKPISIKHEGKKKEIGLEQMHETPNAKKIRNSSFVIQSNRGLDEHPICAQYRVLEKKSNDAGRLAQRRSRPKWMVAIPQTFQAGGSPLLLSFGERYGRGRSVKCKFVNKKVPVSTWTISKQVELKGRGAADRPDYRGLYRPNGQLRI